jgi:hypothetical protein
MQAILLCAPAGRLTREDTAPPFFAGCHWAQVPPELDIHLIVDNYGTHKTAIIRYWLAERPRFHVHVTDVRLMAE